MTRTQAPSTPLTEDDLEIMRILHRAFRRDGARLARTAERYGTESEETHDALLVGWHGFSSSLHHHHTIEDAHIWPVMRAKLADRPDDLAVLDAMEAEHALIDPALEALERAFDDREADRDEVAALFKTAGKRAEALVARIGELHSYAVPAAVVWPIEGGLEAYRDWVLAESKAAD